jgi:hypothetical protein
VIWPRARSPLEPWFDRTRRLRAEKIAAAVIIAPSLKRHDFGFGSKTTSATSGESPPSLPLLGTSGL